MSGSIVIESKKTLTGYEYLCKSQLLVREINTFLVNIQKQWRICSWDFIERLLQWSCLILFLLCITPNFIILFSRKPAYLPLTTNRT